MSEQWHCAQLVGTDRDGPVVVCEREDLMRRISYLETENDDLVDDLHSMGMYNKKLRESLLQAGVHWTSIPAFYETVEEKMEATKESK